MNAKKSALSWLFSLYW